MTEPDHTSEQHTAPATGPAADRHHITTTHRRIIAAVAAGSSLIAAIGFTGSYNAVTRLALRKGFGWFSYVFPIGVDAGIVVLLALDLVLTWLRMPLPLLRHIAWLLTGATVAFNAAASWGDWVAVGMHATIPVLFVAITEAARHAVGRVADITADKHIDGVPLIRWIVAPASSFRIWRRMRKWHLRSYEQVVTQQRAVRVFRAQLRKDYGKQWKRTAPADKLLVFELDRFGISVSDALAIPEMEAEAHRRAEAKRKAEARAQAEAEAEALRFEEAQRRAETEARRIAEAEAAARVAEVEAAQRIAEAEAAARLAEVERSRQLADAQAEAHSRRLLEEQRAAEAEAELERRRQIEASARGAAEAEAEALRLAEKRRRLEAETPAASKPKPETEAAAAPKPKRPAEPKPKSDQVGGKRAQIASEVETLVKLMADEGYDAVTLKRATETFPHMSQTTAWDRLLRAQKEWKARAA